MARRVDAAGVAVWRERIGRFEGAGVTVAAFCAGEGVSVPSFYQWRRRLVNETRESDCGAAEVSGQGFARVRVTRGLPNATSSSPCLVAILPGGTRIELALDKLALDGETSLTMFLRALFSAERDANQGVASC